MLFIKKKVSYRGHIDRRASNSNAPKDITDENIDDRIDKFTTVINSEKIYRIPLRYFYNLGKKNFPLKIDFKIKCNLEKEIKFFFEFDKKVANITAPEEKIIFTKALFIQYEQFKLNKSFIQYIEAIMISTKILIMGIQKALLQKAYEMVVGSQSFNIEFLGSHRQFD